MESMPGLFWLGSVWENTLTFVLNASVGSSGRAWRFWEQNAHSRAIRSKKHTIVLTSVCCLLSGTNSEWKFPSSLTLTDSEDTWVPMLLCLPQ
ncbi:Elongation Factor Tu [Manis pentadactyla]|nr:Elongation Factor Tu [Manis pentadactyla]